MANLKTMRIQAAIDAVRLNIEDESAPSFPAQPQAVDDEVSLRAEIAALEKRRDALHLQIADLEAHLNRLQKRRDELSREIEIQAKKEGSSKAPRRTAATKRTPAPAAKDLAGLQKLKDAFAGFDTL